MTHFFARYEQTGKITAGPMDDGEVYSGIDEGSRFWSVVQAWESTGHNIEPYSPPAATSAEMQLQFSSAIQSHLDATASQRRYDSIHTAISYRDDPSPKFAAEAAALFAWRSAVWTYATDELDKVVAGERAIPTVEEFLSELPVLVWPSA